ncbi:MAG: ribonuclease HII [Candidatus Pacearchaeota archaeon]|nr:ribonuclease HII [Candidatus Pacearchaeota archaeon]
MLVLGIDDAGRGPLIGPMVLAGVLLEKEKEIFLKEKGVKDSKLLSHNARISLSKIIKENALNIKTIKIYPEEIDRSINTGINLNTLEALKMAEIINSLNDNKSKIHVFVDCPSINTRAWRSTLIGFIKHPENLEFTVEHKADFLYPSTSAASIIAKVEREDEVAKLKEQYKKYGDIGSGYPSDPITQEFLKKNGEKLKDSGIFRKTWKTWKSIFQEKKQSSLLDF